MTIGERIKALREAKNLSQSELAEMVGYKDRTAIAKIESGERELRQSKILPFAKALDTDPLYILGIPKDEESASPEHDALEAKVTKLIRQLTDEELAQTAYYLDFLLSLREKQGTS